MRRGQSSNWVLNLFVFSSLSLQFYPLDFARKVAEAATFRPAPSGCLGHSSSVDIPSPFLGLVMCGRRSVEIFESCFPCQNREICGDFNAHLQSLIRSETSDEAVSTFARAFFCVYCRNRPKIRAVLKLKFSATFRGILGPHMTKPKKGEGYVAGFTEELWEDFE